MVTPEEVERQLQAVGIKRSFIIRAEIRELQHILVPGEQLQFCIAGRYEGGFAMICATDQRVLLVDKKPLYLTMEDIRYDMVSEVDFSARLIDSSIRICTPNKDLRFRSLSGSDLRKMTAYIQHRIMEFRQQHMMGQPFDAQSLDAPVPLAPTLAATQPMMTPAQYQIQYDNAQATQLQAASQPLQTAAAGMNPVSSLPHHVINPYLKVPLMMRRRVSRFPSI